MDSRRLVSQVWDARRVNFDPGICRFLPRRSEQRQRWCFQNADSPLLHDGIHFSYNTTLLPFFHLQVPRPLLLSRFQTRRSDFLRLDGTGASAQFWVKLCCQSDARQQRKLHPTVAKEIL